MAWCKARAARVLSEAAREAGWLCLCEIPQVGKPSAAWWSSGSRGRNDGAGRVDSEYQERLGEMPKGALPFDLPAFATTIGQRYSMTQNEIIRLVMKEAEALGDNYRIGSSSR